MTRHPHPIIPLWLLEEVQEVVAEMRRGHAPSIIDELLDLVGVAALYLLSLPPGEVTEALGKWRTKQGKRGRLPLTPVHVFARAAARVSFLKRSALIGRADLNAELARRTALAAMIDTLVSRASRANLN